jgi:hypothetical protein
LVSLIAHLFMQQSTEREAEPLCYELLRTTSAGKEYALRRSALGYLVRLYCRDNAPRLADTLKQLVDESATQSPSDPAAVEYLYNLAATSRKIGDPRATELVKVYRDKLAFFCKTRSPKSHSP